jgi:pantothenate kinase
LNNYDFDESKLSFKQKDVIEILNSQLEYLKNKNNKPEHQIIIWIQGSAGTGKSTLIKLIQQKILLNFEKTSCKVMATTGVSSNPINNYPMNH